MRGYEIEHYDRYSRVKEREKEKQRYSVITGVGAKLGPILLVESGLCG